MSVTELPDYLTPETLRAVQQENVREAELRELALFRLQSGVEPLGEYITSIERTPTPAEEVPVEAIEPAPEVDLDPLARPPLQLTTGQVESVAMKLQKSETKKQLTARMLDTQLMDQRRKEKLSQLRNNDITIEGDVVGDFMKSNIVLGMDGGYIRDPETGEVRKGTTPELFVNMLGSQTLYEGEQQKRRVDELRVQRAEKFARLMSEGKTEEEADEELDSFFDGELTKFATRGIVETRLQESMRALGITEAAVGEIVFDHMPLFYEIDENGEPQDPDSLVDNVAHFYDRRRQDFIDATGMSREAVNSITRTAMLPLFGPQAYLLPAPFQAIDRDTPTSLPESGLRTAARTGGAINDMLMAGARGRTLQDELLSIPAYRDYLGDYQMLSLIPALIYGSQIPILPPSPLKAVAGVAKVAKAGARTTKAAGTVGKFVDQAADAVLVGVDKVADAQKLASPARWAGAYSAHRELSQLVDDAGGLNQKMPTMVDMVLDRGDPAAKVAAVFDDELSTPFKVRARLVDDEGVLTNAELQALLEGSHSGRHILRRVQAEDVGELDELSRLRGVLSQGDQEVTAATRALFTKAIDEWNVGLETSTLRSRLAKVAEDIARNNITDPTKQAALYADATREVMQSVVRGGAVPAGFADVLNVARRTKDPKKIVRAFEDAARLAGSAPIRSTQKRMAMYLDLARTSSRAGSRDGLRAVSALAPLFRPATGVLAEADDAIKYSSALSRAGRRIFADVVRGRMSNNMVFVTERAMIPRKMVTRNLMKKVGTMERRVFEATAKGDDVFELKTGDADNLKKVVESVVPRSADLQDVFAALDKGEWDATMQAFIHDAVREAQYRKLLGDKAIREAVFESREVQLARRPTISGTSLPRENFTQAFLYPIMDTFVATRGAAMLAAEAAAQALPTSRPAGWLVGAVKRANERYDQKAMARWFKQDSPTAPAVVATAKAKIANIVGTVGSRHRTEMMERVREARAAGAGADAEEIANTKASQQRWNQLREDAVKGFREAVRLERAMHQANAAGNGGFESFRRIPSEAEVVMQVLFRNDDLRVLNLGVVLESVRSMDVDRQAQLIEMAEELVAQGAYRKQWHELMSRFFLADTSIARLLGLTDENDTLAKDLGPLVELAMYEKSDALLAIRKAQDAANDSAIDATAQTTLDLLIDLTKAPIRVPDQAGVAKVVEAIRSNEKFANRGAARARAVRATLKAKQLRVYEDAIDDAVSAWQLSADTTRRVGRVWEDLFRRSPELRVDLVPSSLSQTKYSQAAQIARYQAPVSVVINVISELVSQLRIAGDLTDEMEAAAIEAVRYARLPALAEASGARVPRATKSLEDGRDIVLRNPLLDPITNWAQTRMRNLSRTEMQSMGESAANRMASTGTLYPDYRTVGIVGAGKATHTNTEALNQGIARVVDAAEGTRDLTPINKFMFDAIQLLKKNMVLPEGSTTTRAGYLTTRLIDASKEGINEALAPFIFDQVRGAMRRWGFTAFGTKEAATHTVRVLRELPTGQMYSWPMTPGMDEVGRALHEMAVNGKLLSTLDNLHKRTFLETGGLKGYSAFALQSILDTGAYLKQCASYGLLSAGVFMVTGVPIPGVPLSRYIGLNLLTAPFMMIGTLGFSGAMKGLSQAAKIGAAEALPKGAQRLADLAPSRFTQALADKTRALVNTVKPRAPDDVMFVDMYGKAWSAAEFEDLCGVYNVMMSRGDVDQAADLLATLRRDMNPARRRKGDKMPERALNMALGAADTLMNPSLTSLGMQFATYTDGVFRRGVFASAIRDGMQPLQAAELARASVLDYGAIPDVVRQSVNRYLLFASFRMSSMREILMALTRADDSYLRVIRSQMTLHKNAGLWAFGNDYDRVRLYSMPGPKFDGLASGIGGPQDVMSTGMADIVDLMFFMGEVAAGESRDTGARITDALMEEQIQPLLQAAIAQMQNKNPSRKGRMVPDTSVVYWMNNGNWQWAQDRYFLTEVGHPLAGKDRRRRGTPEFDERNGRGIQFEFGTGPENQNGYRIYQADKFLAIQLMTGRVNDDLFKALISAGYGPAGYNPKYRKVVPYPMYLIGAGTPTRVKDPESERLRAFSREASRVQ